MRRAVLVAAAVCLLAGPTVLAFFSGGYFTEPRLIAAIVAWALVLALAAREQPPLPRRLPGALALGGLALLTVWSAVSIAWAPLGGPAVESVQRLAALHGRAAGRHRRRCATPRLARAVEPALAAGATIVIGYGLAGRLLPGIVELERSARAGGRLEQPITYWNAEGALAAVGLVLCARLAGDRSRPTAVRARPRRPPRRSAPASTCPTRAARSRPRSRGCSCSSPRRRRARSCARRRSRSPPARRPRRVAAAFPGVAALEGTRRTRDGALALAVLRRARRGGGSASAPRARGGDAPLTLGAPAPRRRGRRSSRLRWPGSSSAGSASGRAAAELAAGADARPAHHRELEPLRVLAGRPRGLRPRAADRASAPAASASSGCRSARSARPCATPTRSRSRWPPSSGSSGCSRSRCWSAGVALAARERPAARPRGRGRRLRRHARVVPPRVDRLGLAAAGGHPARDRARRGARGAQRRPARRADPAARRAASARRAAAGSRVAADVEQHAPGGQVVGLAAHARPRAAPRASLLPPRAEVEERAADVGRGVGVEQPRVAEVRLGARDVPAARTAPDAPRRAPGAARRAPSPRARRAPARDATTATARPRSQLLRDARRLAAEHPDGERAHARRRSRPARPAHAAVRQRRPGPARQGRSPTCARARTAAPAG